MITTVGVVIGIVTGIAGLILGYLGWRRSGQALTETRRTTVRENQHVLIAAMASPASELDEILTELNVDLQMQPADVEALRSKAARIRSLVTDLASPVIVDPTLSDLIKKLESAALPTDQNTEDIPTALERFARLWNDVAEANAKPDSRPTREQLFNLGAGFGLTIEPLRERCNALQPIVQQIRERLREIDLYGLGNFPAQSRKRGPTV